MRVALLVLAIPFAISACRGSGNEQLCPLGIPDTRVSLKEEPDRVIVSFSTTKVRVPDLRARVVQQVGQNGPERHEGSGHEGQHGLGHGHGLRLWEMPALRTIVEETPDGARLHVKPLASEDLPALTEKMRARVRALEEKDCP